MHTKMGPYCPNNHQPTSSRRMKSNHCALHGRRMRRLLDLYIISTSEPLSGGGSGGGGGGQEWKSFLEYGEIIPRILYGEVIENLVGAGHSGNKEGSSLEYGKVIRRTCGGHP